jgi:exodeoxyribonuclease-3
MKIVSFNANGIRARQNQLEALTEQHHPDIMGIQETKVSDDLFPLESIEQLGYRACFHGQKGHYGVALLSREIPTKVTKGYPVDGEESQRRIITGEYALPRGESLTVINGYFPQGENRKHEVKFPAKRKFYEDLLTYLQSSFSPASNLIVMGDFNVAPLDLDVGIGPNNAKRWLQSGKCSFLPEEREWLGRLLDWGLYDAYRQLQPDANDRFSWFDYRSRGFERDPKRGLRIDLLLVTKPLVERCTEAGIDYRIRAMPKASDHCPVWARFDL